MRLIPVIACTLALLTLAMPTTLASHCPVDTTPNFTDTCYHEYLLYNVDAAEVDILILPSVDQYSMRDAEILKASSEAWDTGINNLAPDWLADELNLHVYRVGLDNTPESALADPEIVITTGEVNPFLLFGIGLQIPFQFCHHQPWPLMVNSFMELPEFHQHETAEGAVSGMLSVECDAGGFTCMVINTNFYTGSASLENMRDMYDLNSHELGHCLGIGHVGDAGDFSATSYPRDDIMSYEQDNWEPAYVLCVSTLNIKALETVYGHMLGESGYPIWPAGGYVHQEPTAWDDDDCTDPVNHLWTDFTPVTESEVLGGGGGGVLDPVFCMVDAVVNGLLLNWPGPFLDCVT